MSEHAEKPSPMDEGAQGPSPVDELAAQQSPVDEGALGPSPVDELAAQQSPVDELAAQPSHLDELAAEPSPVDTLPVEPSPVDALAELYSRAAPTYAELGPPYFAHAGRRLVDLAAVRAGDVVLDVATGRGAVLLPAARRVGPSGRVVGIDIAPGMIELTRASIARDGLGHASVEQMDAANLGAFEAGVFSHALCSFAVFFFPDVRRVLSELRRVLRPGGMVGFAFSRGRDPRWSWYEELLQAQGAFDGPDYPRPRGQPGIRNAGNLAAALAQTGFVDIVDNEEAVELFYPSPEAWWASLWAHGSRTPLERLEPDVLRRVQTECLERVRGFAQAAGVPERMRFAFVLATRSAEKER